MKITAPGNTVSLLVVFALCRGSAYGFTNVALDHISAGNVFFLRLGSGALALVAWAGFTLRRVNWVASDWRGSSFYAVFGNALPIGLITIGQQTVPSGLSAVMMSLTPLFSAVLAHLWLPGERLTARAALGLIIGFVGVLPIVMARGGVHLGTEMIFGLAALAAAAICFAGNIVFARVWQPKNQLGMATVSLLMASLTAVPFLQARELVATSEVAAISASIALGVVCTAIALLVMLELSKKAGAAFISTVNYLIPIIGLAIGAIFLGEPLFWSDVVAFALIVCGTRLVQPGQSARLRHPEPATGETA